MCTCPGSSQVRGIKVRVLSQMAPALTAALYLSSEVTSDQDLLVTDIRPLLHFLRNHHL